MVCLVSKVGLKFIPTRDLELK
ncbi:UNVERIFIED_CONTAM: hypothetical protein GTU68_035700 [Idotea baltica]|nr:hypothetical protein [Idotea baltica]